MFCRNGQDHDVSGGSRITVFHRVGGCFRADFLQIGHRRLGFFQRPGADDDFVSRFRPADGQPCAEIAGTAENGDGFFCCIQVLSRQSVKAGDYAVKQHPDARPAG